MLWVRREDRQGAVALRARRAAHAGIIREVEGKRLIPAGAVDALVANDPDQLARWRAPVEEAAE